MKYCSSCILPDTRPNIELNEDGVCNACVAHASKASISWPDRARAFEEVAAHARSRSSGYDCIIPVSGGKDSTWQVVTCKDHGLNPLAVTWKTPARTDIGRRNLENLVQLGVDHIDYRINPVVEKKFMLLALERFGSTAIPMHMALFNIPLKIAMRFGIPLIVWGENSAFEYGGPEEARTGFRLDHKWLEQYGVTHGTSAGDWVGQNLSKRELTPYVGPSSKELKDSGTLAVFLGYYFKWDPEETRRIAKQHGFKEREEGPRTGYWNFADIDDDFISIHHYLKWYKFGFTRLFDNLSVEIRNRRLTREQAIDIVRQRGLNVPNDDIHGFCEFVGISRATFDAIVEGFRNRSIWVREDGRWVIPDFLVSDWAWEVA